MTAETRKRIQLALLAALALATLRAGYIFYQRHEDQLAVERKKRAEAVGYSNADYYVNPKKLYPYDLKSAKQLTQQPVWVKEGYRYTYFAYPRSPAHNWRCSQYQRRSSRSSSTRPSTCRRCSTTAPCARAAG